jgi:TRAP-type mannitol/chloroaromatic compound transport system substrate-binding protein
MTEFGFNRKAYEALPADLRRILDLATTAVQVHGLMDFHAKNVVAVERLRTEFKGKVELVQFPAPVLRDLKTLARQVIKEHSEKSPMAKKVHASFTRFQAQLGSWDHVALGAYHEFLKG